MNTAGLDKLIACRDCDLLIERVVVKDNQKAHCPRCKSILYQGRRDHLVKTIIGSGSGLLMVIPAYYLPMMDMQALGIVNSTSVLSSIPPMMNSTFWIAGLGLLLFAVIFPVMILLISFWVSLHLKFNVFPRYLCELQKVFQTLIRWGMPEVYILGLVVAFVKLLDDFTVHLGPGMYSFVLMMFCSLLVTTTVSKQYFWERLYNANKNARTEARTDAKN